MRSSEKASTRWCHLSASLKEMSVLVLQAEFYAKGAAGIRNSKENYVAGEERILVYEVREILGACK